MRNIFLLLLILFAFGCDKNEYTAYLRTPDLDSITSISLYPNSSMLTADGTSELKFKIRAFMEIKDTRRVEYIINNQSVIKDSTFVKKVPVPMDRIPAKDIIIETVSGTKIENFTYKTAQGAGSEVQFICKIGNVVSAPCKVQLVAKPVTNYSQITIPVVFHLLVTDASAAKFASVTPEFLNGILDRANKVFSGAQSPDPMAADAKINFKLASVDTTGALLPRLGINEVDMKDSKAADIITYINKNLLWNPNKYLNIYISTAIYGNTSKLPKYKLNNGSLIPGITFTSVADASLATFTTYDAIGVTLSINSIYTLNAPEASHFEYTLGTFFGLLPTVKTPTGGLPYVNGDVDYCPDTYTYTQGPIYMEKYTYSNDPAVQPVYYDSFNIMDGTSKSTSLTHAQAARLRSVIENCPLRMMRE